MRSSNDHFFYRSKNHTRGGARVVNERRAAIARAVMAPRDVTPAPAGTVKALRTAWRSFCRTTNEEPQRARTARLGRVRIASSGSLSSLRRGDLVLVWDNHRGSRTPLYSVWHPRNPIMTAVSKEEVDLVCEGPVPEALLKRPRPKKRSR
jgi:hypothetical protein